MSDALRLSSLGSDLELPATIHLGPRTPFSCRNPFTTDETTDKDAGEFPARASQSRDLLGLLMNEAEAQKPYLAPKALFDRALGKTPLLVPKESPDYSRGNVPPQRPKLVKEYILRLWSGHRKLPP